MAKAVAIGFNDPGKVDELIPLPHVSTDEPDASEGWSDESWWDSG